ncbi:MAG: hypothetical protein ACJA2E_001173, partial [Arenicella sp.]
ATPLKHKYVEIINVITLMFFGGGRYNKTSFL